MTKIFNDMFTGRAVIPVIRKALAVNISSKIFVISAIMPNDREVAVKYVSPCTCKMDQSNSS